MAGRLTRPTRRPDERGSLVMAMLLITVGMMCAGLLAPVVLTQFKTSSVDIRREQSLDAAQAGFQAMVGQIRSANDGSGGPQPPAMLSGLPCNAVPGPGAAISGQVTSAGTEFYQTWVYYFSSANNPHGQSIAWIKNSSNQVQCIPNNGTKTSPAYAVIVSQGTDAAQGSPGNQTGDFSGPTRTLQATYVFQSLNTNVPGGQLHLYPRPIGSPDYCLDAGSSSPASGTYPTVQLCDSSKAQQIWAWNLDNSITLASTADRAHGVLGMCLDAPYNASAQHTLGEQVKLVTCTGPTPPSEQQWAFDGDRPFDFIGIQGNGAQQWGYGVSTDNGCWTPSYVGVGATLTLNNCTEPCCALPSDSVFTPDQTVGAGSATGANGYLNNYAQFGRCMDITLAELPTRAATPYVINYICRSTPDANMTPHEAQIWSTPSVPTTATHSIAGPIQLKYDDRPIEHSNGATIPSNADRTNFCLTEPTGAGYPTMQTCTGGTTQKWTVWGNTGDYSSSYRIIDAAGLCLAPDPNDTTTAVSGPNIAKIVVTTCSGDTLQKWNAPPGVIPQPITDIHEMPAP